MSPPDQGFYRKPLFVAFRGGTAAELVTGAGAAAPAAWARRRRPWSISWPTSRPSPSRFSRKMKDIAEKDIPELNKLLAAKGVPYIK